MRERLKRYQAVGVGTIQAKLAGSVDERLATLSILLELCAELEADRTTGSST